MTPVQAAKLIENLRHHFTGEALSDLEMLDKALAQLPSPSGAAALGMLIYYQTKPSWPDHSLLILVACIAGAITATLFLNREKNRLNAARFYFVKTAAPTLAKALAALQSSSSPISENHP
jgi:hypothetical protein